MPTCMYHGGCDQPANHVHVDRLHSVPDEVEYFCDKHAQTEGRGLCSMCESDPPSIELDNGDFYPVFLVDEMDGDRHCGFHG